MKKFKHALKMQITEKAESLKIWLDGRYVKTTLTPRIVIPFYQLRDAIERQEKLIKSLKKKAVRKPKKVVKREPMHEVPTSTLSFHRRYFRKGVTRKQRAFLMYRHYHWVLQHPEKNDSIIQDWSKWCTRMLKSTNGKKKDFTQEEKIFLRLSNQGKP